MPMEHTRPETAPRSMWEKVQTYFIVTLVAVLIWLYSESENVKLQKPLQLTVQFVAPPGQEMFIVPATRQQVQLTVSSATSQYDHLQRLQVKPIELIVTDDPDNPQQTVVLRDKLLNSPVGDLGVSIVDLQPRTLDLRVERIEQVTVPISTESIVPPGAQLASAPVIVPSEVTVGLPASLVYDLDNLKVEAKVDPDNVARLEENVPHKLTVPLTLPGYLRDQLFGKAPDITPPTASITITIRKQTDTHTLTGVPILITAPWYELKRFAVQLQDDQRVLSEDVRLTGPSDVIDQIRKGESRVLAELRLSADDLESRITTKQLFLNVPTGVRVESTIPHVNFTITPIADSAAPRPPTPGPASAPLPAGTSEAGV